MKQASMVFCLTTLIAAGCCTRPPETLRTVNVVDQLEASLPASAGSSPVVAAAAVGNGSVVVMARIAPGWHIYPLGETSGPYIPTAIQAELPKGAEWAGDWRLDPAGDPPQYEGTITFTRAIRAGGEISSIPIEFSYQACDAFSCRPPATVKLSATTEKP